MHVGNTTHALVEERLFAKVDRTFVPDNVTAERSAPIMLYNARAALAGERRPGFFFFFILYIICSCVDVITVFQQYKEIVVS